MLQTPVFKPQFLVNVLKGGKVLLLSDNARYLLEGELYERVARLVDGRRTTSEIVRVLEGVVPAEKVEETLQLLASKGYITEAGESLPRAMAAFWEVLGVESADAAHRLGQARVSVLSFDEAFAIELGDALAKLGIRSGADGFRVIAVADYLDPCLPALNREALSTGNPFMLLKPVGCEPWIGPIVVPGETGCWACLAHRLKENRWVESSLWGPAYHAPMPATPIAALPSTAAAALQIAATQVANWVAGGSATLKGRLWSLDYRTLEGRVHVLARRPQCPECGHPKPVAPVRVVLGTNEPPTIAPDSVARELEAHVSPITGIVPILQKSGECAGVHVYQARYNSALPLTSEPVRVIREPGYAVGKGFTDGQARASCLAEAVERYSAVHQGCEPCIRANYRDIRDQAVHPEDLLLFSAQQYRNRDQWNRTHAANHWVPWPFDESAVIDWTPCWSLTRGEFRYMPVAWCYLDYQLTDTAMFCAADTNGCAAGSSLGEAVLRGSLELVERDAVAIWWYNRVRRPSVPIEELDDPWLALVEAQLRASGRSLHVLDITTDLDIPVFVAVSAEVDGTAVLFGTGAHLHPHLAAKQAIAELCQVLSGLDGRPTPPNIAHWLQTATLENQPYLAPLEGESCSARAFRTPAGETPWLICRRQGMETLVLDLTRPDTGLMVVRVSVPGLRHHWSRFAPGRLYEVPVKMGWLEAPTEESQLNPIPFFL